MPPVDPCGATRTRLAPREQIVGVARRIPRLVLSGCRHEATAFFVDHGSGAGRWAALNGAPQDGIARRMPRVRAAFEALFADRVPAAAFAARPMPVGPIGGRRSPLAARQGLERLAALLPHATCSWIDAAGHMAPVTPPERVAVHLRAWRWPADERRAA